LLAAPLTSVKIKKTTPLNKFFFKLKFFLFRWMLQGVKRWHIHPPLAKGCGEHLGVLLPLDGKLGENLVNLLSPSAPKDGTRQKSNREVTIAA
jgi:hypothetical protein